MGMHRFHGHLNQRMWFIMMQMVAWPAICDRGSAGPVGVREPRIGGRALVPQSRDWSW